MNVVKATLRYERWLSHFLTLVKPDLRLKHQRMAESSFAFFRATFYRWMQTWPELCSDLTNVPRILAVGDLHVENFGTWRDIEGRLVWGVNDFDEAEVLPYTLDLVRLSASALLAIEEGHLAVKGKDACAAVLDGYREALVENGRPFVLEEDNGWLRAIATNELRDPVHFWSKASALAKFTGHVPAEARQAFSSLMPAPKLPYSVFRRAAGLGSLGHPRLVAIAQWHGGRIAREAKELAPSAVYWARQKKAPDRFLYQSVLNAAVRCPDPFVRLYGRWIGRRLSPHCSRIELSVLPRDREELRLLNAMGWETANIHLGTRKGRKEIQHDLDRRKASFLFAAAKAMVKAVKEDWRMWKESQ
jgi:Uncharacterized protein conserved in bacteria (DUF2252)